MKGRLKPDNFYFRSKDSFDSRTPQQARNLFKSMTKTLIIMSEVIEEIHLSGKKGAPKLTIKQAQEMASHAYARFLNLSSIVGYKINDTLKKDDGRKYRGSDQVYIMCQRKKKFSKEHADVAAKNYQQRAYECLVCGKYHLTSITGGL